MLETRPSTAPRVLFLYPPYYWAELDSKILLLRAWVEGHGVATADLIRRDAQSVADLARALEALPEVELLVYYHGWWGAEFSSQQVYFYRGISKLFKKVRPSLRIAAIGDYPMYAGEPYLRAMPQCDFVITTDGYVPLVDYFERGESGKNLDAVRGVVYRKGADLQRTAAPPPVTSGIKGAELDIIPSPYAMGLANTTNYLGHYHTAMGCPYLCAYCRTSVFEGKNVSYFSPERVLADLRLIRDILAPAQMNAMSVGASISYAAGGGLVGNASAGVINVSIEDQTFSLDRERVRRLCRMLIDAKLGLSFNCYTRAHLVDRDLLELMYAAGFRAVQFGFESAVPKVLRAAGRLGVNKGLAANIPAATAGDLPLDPSDLSFKSERAYIQRITESVHTARDVGFKVFMSAIAGLPASTAEDDQKTIDHILDVVKPDYPNINPFLLQPGVRFYEMRKDDLADQLEDNLFELEGMKYDLEELDFRGRAMGPTHLVTLIEQVLDKLDGRVATTVDRAAICFADVPVAEGLDDLLSTGAYLVHVGSNREFRSQRDAAAPYMLLDLFDGDGGHVGPKNWRFQIRRRDVPMASIVDAAGEIDASRFAKGHALKVWPRGDDLYRITLQEDRDVDAWQRLSVEAARRGTLRLSPQLANDYLYFEDSCRWAAAPCPAPKLFRISRKQDGVAPCPTGAAVAPLGTDVPGYRQRLATLQSEVEARRGCATCEVRERCARCPLTGPVTEQRYCQLQKARGGGGWLDFRAVQHAMTFASTMAALVGDPAATFEVLLRGNSGVVAPPPRPADLAELLPELARPELVPPNHLVARHHPGAPWQLLGHGRALEIEPEIAVAVNLVLDRWSLADAAARLADRFTGIDAVEVAQAGRETLATFATSP